MPAVIAFISQKGGVGKSDPGACARGGVFAGRA